MLQAAREREVETRMRAAFRVCWLRYLNQLDEWQVERVMTTARLLRMRPEKVTVVDIALCRFEHGRPAGPETKPVFRMDRRYGPRPMGGSAR